MEWEIGEK